MLVGCGAWLSTVSCLGFTVCLYFWRQGFPFYHKTHRSLGGTSGKRMRGNPAVCQAGLQAALKLFHVIRVGTMVKSLFYLQIPNPQAMPIFPARLQVSAGARVLPFSAREPLGGQCRARCTNTLSPLAYKAATYGCDVFQTGFSSFWQPSPTRFPSRNDLAQIHGKHLGASNMPSLRMAFHRREAALQHPRVHF